MKIAVFSDSHNKTEGIDTALDEASADIDAVIHLGDGCYDIEKYRLLYPKLEFFDVRGNCDYGSCSPAEHILELADKRIFITHGHLYDVKCGYEKIISAAKNKSADICMFGHTHEAVIFYEEEILFLNPGSITYKNQYGYRSFAILDITSETADINILRL